MTEKAKAEADSKEVRVPEPPFVPGLELARRFYHEIVQPMLSARCPKLRYSAARIGPGSDVLGFDTPRSRDHDWGPKFDLFLHPDGFADAKAELDRIFQENLPLRFLGYSVRFKEGLEPDGKLSTSLNHDDATGRHGIRILTLESFSIDYLNWRPTTILTHADWLTIPSQHLRTIAVGGVFHDGLGLEEMRATLRWYPKDVWLFMLACGWRRISQEEHLMPRAGEAGDELGSRIIASRLVRDLMRICLLMEKEYPPYPKWFGTAFSRLRCAAILTPLFEQTLNAGDWKERQEALGRAYEEVTKLHNALGITKEVDPRTSQFFERPFTVIWGHRFMDVLKTEINDMWLLKLLAQHPIGSVDQFVDNTDALYPSLRLGFRDGVYRVD